MEYKILSDKIVYFEKVILNYQELIDLANSLNCKSVTPWEVWKANGSLNSDSYGEIKFLNRKFYNQENEEDKKKSIKLIETLCDSIILCAKKYSEIYNIPEKDFIFFSEIIKDNSTKIGFYKYDQGVSMGPHLDLNKDNSYLEYTVVIYMNSDYEGGELNFPNHNITIKPSAGSIAIYPSGDPFLHESKTVTKGNKILITHHLRKPD